MDISQAEIGLKVVTNSVIDIFPLNIWPAGTKGTIVAIDQSSDQKLLHVELDEPFRCLDDWDNCLQVWEVADEANSDCMLSAFDLYNPEEYPDPRAYPLADNH